VIRFLYTHVAGLRQAEGSRAWERFEIQPVLGGNLTSAQVRYLCPQGPIDVQWRVEAETFQIDGTVPSRSRATAVLPDGAVAQLNPGTHRLSCALSAAPTSLATR
jgi:alpha-L-rhamnosidase